MSSAERMHEKFPINGEMCFAVEVNHCLAESREYNHRGVPEYVAAVTYELMHEIKDAVHVRDAEFSRKLSGAFEKGEEE